MSDKITTEKIEKYLSITTKAIEGVKIAKEKNVDWRKMAEDFLDMASRYLKDAKHYYSKGDVVIAFASVNYAHGWLDAGARLGFWDIDKEVRDYFVVD
ncbi:DUF357 domain-containing protein [Candidatus Woesearchaeota archaeon]|nr:DUF357 domain-containing protein [Candidatus Woesearchaeota archaeon]HIH37976.1 DUF357 domain-containing protein [Candidatus Woesearchaeota archaeon]HIH48149.1 DUF357 domain-containing protein [Candidatus Woesearchaeota archaeon]HIJ03563.1 DUF357 domain-containing protein [Candidatus Woesearchaeota archaeon]